MPTYVYELVKPDGTPEAGTRFEIDQSIKDPALTKHPQTGKPVRRVIQSVSILGGSAGTSASASPSGGGNPGAGRCGPSCGCH